MKIGQRKANVFSEFQEAPWAVKATFYLAFLEFIVSFTIWVAEMIGTFWDKMASVLYFIGGSHLEGFPPDIIVPGMLFSLVLFGTILANPKAGRTIAVMLGVVVGGYSIANLYNGIASMTFFYLFVSLGILVLSLSRQWRDAAGISVWNEFREIFWPKREDAEISEETV
jgi:hypothetical protein